MNYNVFRNDTLVSLHKIKKEIKHSGGDYMEKLPDMISNLQKHAPNQAVRDSYTFIWAMELKMETHFFLETSELENFLGTTKVTDAEAAKASVLPVAYGYNYDEQPLHAHFGIIHSPSKHNAVGFLCITDIADGSLRELLVIEDQICTIANIDGIEDAIKTGNMYAGVALIINFLLYIQAFPQYVVDGAPDGQEINYTKHSCKIITTASAIIERGSKTPHFRRGHFRLLSSERFVNKRGQIVFVHSSFVGGSAKTVLENAEVIG